MWHSVRFPRAGGAIVVALVSVTVAAGCAFVDYAPDPGVAQPEAKVAPSEVRVVAPDDAGVADGYERVGELTVELEDRDGVTDEAMNSKLQREAAERGCTAVQVLAENHKRGRGAFNRAAGNNEDLIGPMSERKVRAACLREAGASS